MAKCKKSIPPAPHTPITRRTLHRRFMTSRAFFALHPPSCHCLAMGGQWLLSVAHLVVQPNVTILHLLARPRLDLRNHDPQLIPPHCRRSSTHPDFQYHNSRGINIQQHPLPALSQNKRHSLAILHPLCSGVKLWFWHHTRYKPLHHN